MNHSTGSVSRRRLNRRTRFLLTFMAIIAVLTVLIATAVAYRFITDMERLTEQYGDTLAAIFAREALFNAVIPEEADTEALGRLVESFVSGDVLYGQIVHDGKVISEKYRSEPGLPPDLDLPVGQFAPGSHTTRSALSDGTPYIDLIQTFEGRPFTGLRGVVPELVDSYVRVGIGVGRLLQDIQQSVWGVALAALVVVLLGAILVLFSYQRTWKPLEYLNDVMQRFGRGENKVRARVDTGDELETLARSFNEMADAIVKKDEQMYQVNLEMQRANRAKSDFLAAMSHDLKTPLHVISGFTQLMLAGDGGTPSDVHRSHLTAMLRSSDRLLEFIERILSYSRIESGEEPMNCEQVSVRQITLEAVEPLKALAERKGLRLHTTVEAGGGLWADGGKVKQVLSNLVENAIKYTEDGEIHVRAVRRDGGVYWLVRDSGPGIPQRFVSFIFEPFGRLEGTQGTSVSEGMGLGLAIVKRYVDMHGGRITVQSAPGSGSTFEVYLPEEGEKHDHSDR